jgi:hypothetical protein
LQSTPLPYSIQIIQALGPTVAAVIIGLVAAYVAYQQWRTAHARLKLDLFNQRFEIFQVLDEINRAWRGTKEGEWVAEYIGRMRAATERLRKFRLLFPTRIGASVDDLVSTWNDFTAAKAEEDGITTRPSQQWSDHVKKLRRLWDEIEEKNKHLRKEIEDFIRLDWEG